MNIKNLEGIRFADQFSGASVTNKIDAALADTTTLLVVIPSTMGAGNATAISSGKAILDLRAGIPKVFTNYSVSSPAFMVADDGRLISPAFTSNTANASSAGVIRLANTDALKARNAGNTLDLNCLNMNSSNVLVLGDTGGASFAGPVTGITNLSLAGSLSGVTTLTASGQITSTLATGTAPLSITSTTVVPNLNVAMLNSVVVSGVPSTNQVLTATSATAATWSTATASGYSILNKQDVLAAITGDSTDKTMYTYSMPSGTLAASKGVRVTCYFLRTAGAVSPAFKIFFGATTAANWTMAASVTSKIYSIVFNNTGSTTAQWIASETIDTTGPQAFASGTTASEDTNSGSSIVIKATFNCNNTSQVTPKGFLVELIT